MCYACRVLFFNLCHAECTETDPTERKGGSPGVARGVATDAALSAATVGEADLSGLDPDVGAPPTKRGEAWLHRKDHWRRPITYNTFRVPIERTGGYRRDALIGGGNCAGVGILGGMRTMNASEYAPGAEEPDVQRRALLCAGGTEDDVRSLPPVPVLYEDSRPFFSNGGRVASDAPP
jgi:hypothetical protein